MAELQTALDQPDIRVEAMEVLRTLIERMVLTPNETSPNGLAIELFGGLTTIMNLASSTGPALESDDFRLTHTQRWRDSFCTPAA